LVRLQGILGLVVSWETIVLCLFPRHLFFFVWTAVMSGDRLRSWEPIFRGWETWQIPVIETQFWFFAFSEVAYKRIPFVSELTLKWNSETSWFCSITNALNLLYRFSLVSSRGELDKFGAISVSKEEENILIGFWKNCWR